MSRKEEILFLCTGNSCRSQMAEGLARQVWGERFTFHSAGIEKHGMNPLAVRAMSELDIDITSHTSKTLQELDQSLLSCVITVCGHADESCPTFPGEVRRLHVGFDDPPKLAADAGTEEEAMVHYRRVRDEIAAFVEKLGDIL